MANTASSALRVTELDFLTIKENLKNYLRNQTEFQDFDFEGSGMSVLLDILAYNTHYMGYYLNMVGNEMFLDTAQLRNSVISHAKNLNYVPNSPQGAQVKANVVVTPSNTEDQSPSLLTLDRFTKFLAQDLDGINYQFVAEHSNTVAKIGNSFTFNNVMLKQGDVVTRQYLMDATNTSRRFEMPSANVDLTTLTITVQASSTNNYTTEYKLAEDITELVGNSAVYFVEENQNSNYTIYFGDNVIGKKPDNGSVIIATYLDTVGSVANSISKFYISDPIGGEYRDNVIVTAINSSYGGIDKEPLEQVRFRAPYFYTTQNRAVTINDYKTLITKDYNNIDSVAIWGGEDNDPVVYGKVYLSLKTTGNYFLTNYDKEKIKEDLIKKRNILTVTPEIIDPDYTYILVKGQIYYDSKLTSLTSEELVAYAKAAISDYNTQELNKFESVFRKSKLQSYIENSNEAITGSDLTIYAQKRVKLDLGLEKYYDINFNIPLKRNDINNKLFTTPEVQVYDLNGIARYVYFEETPEIKSGINKINIISPGINYSKTPTITIIGDGTGAQATVTIAKNTVSKINIINPGINYSRASVILSGGGGSGAIAQAQLQAKVCTLRTYYFTDDFKKVILNQNAGEIDYETGKIKINSFLTALGTPENRFYDTDQFTINVALEKELVVPKRNQIVVIDENDPVSIQIEAISG